MVLFLLTGLSERLEVQEMYENIQEEKLDTLTDELVTCIAGEEGAGGKINMLFSMVTITSKI